MPDASELSRQRFVVDLMLMRLGRWLRLMGQDAANPEGGSDWQIRDQAKRDHRTVITRDRRLYESCLKASQPCLFIRSSRIEEQLLEVAGAGVSLRLDPQRCTLCNG
ncbi:MAG: Mut7-C RNAse domain-containing protein, partial [Methanothrix sp.]|nr:Mut7-C RNAse domain-containing protein [Methanothrix sp.]